MHLKIITSANAERLVTLKFVQNVVMRAMYGISVYKITHTQKKMY